MILDFAGKVLHTSDGCEYDYQLSWIKGEIQNLLIAKNSSRIAEE